MSISQSLEDRNLNPRLLAPAALLAVVALISILMMSSKQELQARDETPRSIPISAFKAKQQDYIVKIRSQGTIEPLTETSLVAELSGVITWMAPEMLAGGRIEAGQALVRIDPEDYQIEFERSTAASERASAQLNQAQKEHQRISSLHKRKLASDADLDNAESALLISNANAREAKALTSKAKRDLARTEITAPFTGLVRRKLSDLGQFVTRGTILGEAYASETMEVRLPLSNAELAYIRSRNGEMGQSVTLSGEFAGTTKHWQAELTRLEAGIDTMSRMNYAVARFASADPTHPPVGLFVKASINGRELSDVFVIPRTALGNGNMTLRVNSQGRLETVGVDLIRIEGEQAIVQGLNDGDVLSTSSNPTLAPGSLVKANIINETDGLSLEAPAQ